MARRIRKRLVRRPYRRPARITKAGVRSAVGKYKTKVFNNRVKNAVRGMMEVKETYEQGNIVMLPYDTTNGIACDATNVFDYNPVINQGMGVSNRTGNRIDMKSCITRYIITCRPSVNNGTLWPTVVKLIWFYDRFDANNFPTPYQNTDFLQLGNSSQQFQGDLSDILYRYNTDRYRILATRTHKMGYADYSGVLGSGPTQQAYGFQRNNDSKMFVKSSINLTKYILKKQRFNDNLGTSMDRKLYCLILMIAQNGVVMSANQTQNTVEYETIYKYTDA
jgi:hypothetical protein